MKKVCIEIKQLLNKVIKLVLMEIHLLSVDKAVIKCETKIKVCKKSILEIKYQLCK